MMSSELMTENAHKHALVIGLGETGYSCVCYLTQQGFHVSVADTRDVPPKLKQVKDRYPEIKVFTGGLPASAFSAVDMVVVSPGVPVAAAPIAAAISKGVEVIGDIELFARQAPAPIIAVTGTNGKSTVTTLVTEMFQASGVKTLSGGNIGVPVLSLLAEPVPDFYVLELSSFQLETTYSLNAAAATILNISSDHLDRYHNLDEYAGAKARIFQGQGAIVINADDARVLDMVPPARPLIRFSAGPPANENDYGISRHQGEDWLVRGKDLLLPLTALALSGRHNATNVLAALALVEAVGVSSVESINAARRFQGLPHRSQLISRHNNVRWINDSKATNIGATLAALEGLHEPVILIAGGECKDADFAQLQNAVEEHVKTAILIGHDTPLLREALSGCTEIHEADDMQAAVAYAHGIARPGDSVLLAPACASFDMFNNFQERGNAFIRAVQEVTGR